MRGVQGDQEAQPSSARSGGRWDQVTSDGPVRESPVGDVDPVLELLKQAPGAGVAVAALVPSAVIIYHLSNWWALGDLFATLLASAGLLVVSFVWLVRCLAYGFHRWNGSARGGAGWVAATPVVVLVALALGLSPVPADVRFGVSRGSFDEARSRVPMTAHAPVDVDARIGWYHVESAYRVDDAVLFVIEDRLFFEGGIAHAPTGGIADQSLPDGSIDLERLDGPWYRYAWRHG